MTNAQSTLPLRLSTKVGWAAGGAGSTTMLYLVNAMLMYFLVTQLGIAPAVAGTMLMAMRIYDAILDLTIGSLSDRTHSRWGRRRPWMAAGTVVSALGTVAIFLPPLVPGESAKYVQTMLAVLLFFTGYSMFSVPSSAMPAEMTDDYDERTALMSWRTLFLQVAGLVGGAGAPWLVATLGSGRDAYLVMALVAAGFVAVTMVTAVIATRGARSTVRAESSLTRREIVASILGNRPFVVLIAIKFCGYIAIAAMGAVGLFFVRDVLARSESVMAQIQLVSALVGIAALPLWRRFAVWQPKERVYACAMLLNITVSASWLLGSPAEPGWGVIARAFLLGVAASGGLLMSLAMLPDAIEHDFHRTGLRREGIYSGIFEFFQKSAYAVAPFVVGLFLQWNGYASGAAIGGQSAQAVDAIRLTMGALPIVAYGVALVLLLTCYRLPPRG